MSNKTNLLFTCSRNQWRSPTDKALFRKSPDYNAHSAGTSPRAKKTVSASDIAWADIIFVMENKHKNKLKADFCRLLQHKPLHVLDIPDEYAYMAPELLDELQARVGPLLQ